MKLQEIFLFSSHKEKFDQRHVIIIVVVCEEEAHIFQCAPAATAVAFVGSAAYVNVCVQRAIAATTR